MVLAALGGAGLFWSEVHTRGEAEKTERTMAHGELLGAAIAIVDADAHLRALGDPADDTPEKREARATLDRVLVEARKLQMLWRSSGALTSPSADADAVEELANTLSATLEAQRRWMIASGRVAGGDEAIAQQELELVEGVRDQKYEKLQSELNAFRSRQPQPGSVLWMTLRKFALRAAHLASPGLLIVAAMLLLGMLLVWLVPRARQQFEAILANLGDPSRSGAAGPPRLGASSAASQGISALGSLGTRVALGTTAAAVTVGALALAVPGGSFQLALQRPEVSEVGVRVGEFGVDIEGERISLRPGRRTQADVVSRVGPFALEIPDHTFRLDLEEPEIPVGVDIGGFTVSLPDQQIDIPPERVRVSYGASSIEVPEVTVRPPDVRIVVDPAGVPELTRALGELSAQVEGLEGRLEGVIGQTTQVRSASARLLGEAQEAINATNRRPVTALFGQSRIQSNCTRFCDLAATFRDADELQRECARPRRLEPFLPWMDERILTCPWISEPPAGPAAITVDAGADPTEEAHDSTPALVRTSGGLGPGTGR